ncbi:proto-oncogene tyrosine-protein kinase ros [Lasius niger]|uniref:Proto-oncogene tyrosine-protein kinase ros n=1 Tax=Lasius niger TaxID=67767 RepID=A0A0J7K6C8_LASNI|nr:proto-oncogene tyrosine-protein kinase ros [Lasius niger]
MSLHVGPDVILRTNPGKFNAPENVTVQVLTPALVAVYWKPPKKLNCAVVNYEVQWILPLCLNSLQEITYQMPRNKQFINKLEHTKDGKFFTTI